MKKYFLLSLSLFLASFLIASNTPKAHKKAIKKYRKTYKKKFLEPNSPLTKADIKYLRFYKPNFEYRVQGKFTRTINEKPFELPTSSGQIRSYIKYGELTFILKGEQITLSIYQSLQLRQMPQYRDYLFIPFKDLTNGDATYGGGRYIDAKTTDIVSGEMILDFNKSYNPYCAFSDAYSCPIPPDENHLKIKIEAGEQAFAKP